MDFPIVLLLAQDALTNSAIYILLTLALILVFGVTRIVFIPQGELVSYGALTLASLQLGVIPGTVWLLLLLACVAAVMETVRLLSNGSGRELPRVLALALAPPLAIAVLVKICAPLHLALGWQVLLAMLIVTPLGTLVYRVAFRPLETWLEGMIAQGQRPQLALELHNDGAGRLHLSRSPISGLGRHLARMKIFEALLRRHYDRIYRVAWRMTGSAADAEDVAQEVCCTLVEKIGQVLASPMYRCRDTAELDVGHTPRREQPDAIGLVARQIDLTHLVQRGDQALGIAFAADDRIEEDEYQHGGDNAEQKREPSSQTKSQDVLLGGNGRHVKLPIRV